MITLQIPDEKYQFLMKTIDSHRGFIDKLGTNPLIRQSLTKDMQIIKSILRTNQRDSYEKT